MIRSVQALRFLFIMLVVMSHVVGAPFDFGGDCGVAFFFILSGFILSYAYGGRVECGEFSVWQFMKKQLAKIYPLHLLMLLAMVLLDWRLGRAYEWYHLLAHVLLVQTWVPDEGFFFVCNGTSWFLCDILFFYMLFPVLYRRIMGMPLRRLAGWMAVVAVVYLLLAFSIPLERVNAVLYASPALRAVDFAIGIVAFRAFSSEAAKNIMRWIRALPPLQITAVEAMLLMSQVAAFFVYADLTPRLHCASMFWPLHVVFLLFFVMADSAGGLVTRVLHMPLMQKLGGVSLEIFLTHMLTLRVLYSLMAAHGYGAEVRLLPAAIAGAVVLVIVVAQITAVAYSRPVARWINSHTLISNS